MELPVITKSSKSTKTFKLRVLKHFLIDHMESIGYEVDDEGSIITFSNPEKGLAVYYRPSHIDYVDVEPLADDAGNSLVKSEAIKFEKDLNDILEAAIVSINL